MPTITRHIAVRDFALLIVLLVVPACAQAPVISPTTPAVSSEGSVSLLVFPDDDEQVLLDHIASAHHRVWMTMYLLTDDRVIESLLTAQANGANVRVILEANPYNSGQSAGLAREKLSKAGIQVKAGNPVFNYTHQKSLIVDQTGFILTANLTRNAFSSNREFGISVNDPALIDEMTSAFDADWNRAAFAPVSSQLVWSPINAREKIDEVIRSAKKTLMIYAEEVQDDEQTQLLVLSATQGVDVRLLISPPSAEDENDGSTPNLDRLQSGGVKVRLLRHPYIHAKLFMADDQSGVLGSTNISTSSLDFNRELGIVLKDTVALSRLKRTFLTDWNKAMSR